jgi:hypothetical protein
LAGTLGQDPLSMAFNALLCSGDDASTQQRSILGPYTPSSQTKSISASSGDRPRSIHRVGAGREASCVSPAAAMVWLVVACCCARDCSPAPPPNRVPPQQKKNEDFFFLFLKPAPSTLNGHPDFGHEKGIIGYSVSELSAEKKMKGKTGKYTRIQPF